MKASKKKKRRGGWKRTALIVLIVVLSLLLAAIVGVAIYADSLLGMINYIDPSNEATMSPSDASNVILNDPDAVTVDPDSTEPVVRPEDIVMPEEPVDPLDEGVHVLNIMLVGQDRRSGQDRQRSDTMVMVTINRSRKIITLTSFMRDQFVNIPGYGKTKLNHAYQYGGMNLLKQTIYNHYGVEIHGMIEVDFSGFEDIIDLLGGVEIELTKKEVKYLNRNGGWDLSTGVERLNGKQALLYARLRSIDSDYKRAERQRNVLTSIIQEYKNQSLTQMLALLDDILPMITTNIPKSDLTKYLTGMFPMFAGAEVETLRIPADGTFTGGLIRVSEGLNLWCQYNIDFEENREILAELFEE